MNANTGMMIARRPARSTWIGAVLAQARAWAERRRSRRDLRRLDERLLRDIGLTPGEAMREAAMPFWKV